MGQHINRRDFLKIAGTGLAVTTALTGCGPASKFTSREPYTQMPEYNYNGQSTYYATTCRECPAACGLVVRTMQGRAIKIEGNANHPVNLGKTCARGQVVLQGLYDPDRFTGPVSKSAGSNNGTQITWEEATKVVNDALKQGSKTAILTGFNHDHVFDLFSEIAEQSGNRTPVRYSAFELFNNATTLRAAVKEVYGEDRDLVFDLSNADVVFNFGSSFLETWNSPVAYTRKFSQMRRNEKGRGKIVHFEARMSQTAMKADEWIPVAPGMEGLVAKALGKLISEATIGTVPAAFADADVKTISSQTGVSVDTFDRLAQMFVNSRAPLALPPTSSATAQNGKANVTAVLALNALVGNQGVPGGIFFNAAPVLDLPSAKVNSSDIQNLITAMNAGEIETLLIHGVNPVFEAPASLGFSQALAKVKNVISFNPFLDETSYQANYVLPDHTPLESFGYQFVKQGSTTGMLTCSQPVVAPYHNTMSTVDLLLAAWGLPYADEVAYLQNKIAPLMERSDGVYGDFSLASFWAKFQQFGGWWKKNEDPDLPVATGILDQTISVTEPERSGEFYLHTYLSPIIADSGANRPWLQEVPDPSTTVMWNNWLEINPFTAEELGLHNDGVVKVISDHGEVELPILIYPAIRPDVVAIAFGQGHTNHGRYANDRGVNPADLFPAGGSELAVTSGIAVEIHHTDKTQALSRLEGYTRLAQDAGEH